MSYTHVFTPEDPPSGMLVFRRINSETSCECAYVEVDWAAETPQVPVTLAQEATGADLAAVQAIVDDADYEEPVADPEYMVDEYQGNRLMLRTIYADPELTTKCIQFAWEHDGNAVWKETLTEYDPSGGEIDSITWEYETEHLSNNRRRVMKKRIA